MNIIIDLIQKHICHNKSLKKHHFVEIPFVFAVSNNQTSLQLDSWKRFGLDLSRVQMIELCQNRFIYIICPR